MRVFVGCIDREIKIPQFVIWLLHPDIIVTAHVFADSVLQHSLGSISALTNAPNGREVLFSAIGVTVTKNGKAVMHTTI